MCRVCMVPRGGFQQGDKMHPVAASSRKQLEEGCAELRRGHPIILMDSSDREGEGDLAFAAQFATPDMVNLCLTHARGLLCLALRPGDASRLGVTRLPSNDRDPFGTPFGMPINLADGTSGVAASSRAATIRAASDPAMTAERFSMPGHVHTLIGHEQGLGGRTGHTEAILDLLAAARLSGPGVLCEMLDQQGEIASPTMIQTFALERSIPVVYIDAMVQAQVSIA